MKTFLLILFFALGGGVVYWLYKRNQAAQTQAQIGGTVPPPANAFWSGWGSFVTGAQTAAQRALSGNIANISNATPQNSGSGSGAPIVAGIGAGGSILTAAINNGAFDFGGDSTDYGDGSSDLGND